MRRETGHDREIDIVAMEYCFQIDIKVSSLYEVLVVANFVIGPAPELKMKRLGCQAFKLFGVCQFKDVFIEIL